MTDKQDASGYNRTEIGTIKSVINKEGVSRDFKLMFKWQKEEYHTWDMDIFVLK